MHPLFSRALANPWGLLDTVVDGPLHPGGQESTTALLDRAAVTAGTRLIDVGCGAGRSVALARARGAEAVGIDRDPPTDGIRGDLSRLPIRDDSVDVVLAECVLCLAPNRSRVFREARRVLPPQGRLALAAMVVEGSPPELPSPLNEALCLTNTTGRAALKNQIERTGFQVEDVTDHQEDVLAMRDQVAARVDYEALLGQFGEDGERILASLERLEDGVEAGEISYVSIVANSV